MKKYAIYLENAFGRVQIGEEYTDELCANAIAHTERTRRADEIARTNCKIIVSPIFKRTMKKALLFLVLAFASLTTYAQTVPDTRPMCAATTKAGTACKHHAATGTQYCTMHNPETPRCGAATKSGQPCKRTVKVSGAHCSQHSSTPK